MLPRAVSQLDPGGVDGMRLLLPLGATRVPVRDLMNVQPWIVLNVLLWNEKVRQVRSQGEQDAHRNPFDGRRSGSIATSIEESIGRCMLAYAVSSRRTNASSRDRNAAGLRPVSGYTLKNMQESSV